MTMWTLPFVGYSDAVLVAYLEVDGGLVEYLTIGFG